MKIKQSTATRALPFLMIDSSDHLSGKTGLTVTVTLSKNGAAFVSPAGAITEIGSGWYKVAANATDSNTLGALVLHATATGADTSDREFEVVAYDPDDTVRLGLTAVPNAVAAANGGLPTVDASNAVKVQSGTGANQISLSSGIIADPAGVTTLLSRLTSARAGYLDVLNGIVAAVWAAVTDSSGVTTLLSRLTGTRATNLDNLDAAISTRLASASYTAPDNTSIATILTRTDVATSTRAAPGDILQTVGNTINVDSSHCVVARSVDSGLSRSATAQGGTATTITLDAGASAIDDFYVGQRIRPHANTGIGQTRIITAYNGTTKVATVHRAWKTNPDNTSTYALYSDSLEGLQYLDTLLSTINTALSALATKLTGITSVRDWLRLILRKTGGDATAITEVGGTYNYVTDSQEAISDAGTGGGGGTTVLSPTVTFSQVAAAVEAASADTGVLTMRQTCSWSRTLTGLGDIRGYSKVWFTVKRDLSGADTAAIIQIEAAGGLLRLNGATTTGSLGTLSVDDDEAGDITITLDETATALVPAGVAYWYDVKVKIGSDVDQKTVSRLRVSPVVTKAVS